MSSTDLANLSTSRLIRQFVESADRVGSAYTVPLKMRPSDPRAQALYEELHAIGKELRARKAVAEVRTLFNHESRDVRAWAAGQFGSIDREWSSATFCALGENLSTREVIALMHRAQQPPPKQPSLNEMSIDQLVARFEDAGIRQYATRFLANENGGPDTKHSNRITRETQKVAAELKARGALHLLRPFLEASNMTLRFNAAVYCLPIETERALHILEEMDEQRDDPHLSVQAFNVLDRWKRGVLGTTSL